MVELLLSLSDQIFQILQLQKKKYFNDYNSMQKSISKTCWRGVETYLMRRQIWNCSSLSLSDQILQLTSRETSGKEDRIKYLR